MRTKKPIKEIRLRERDDPVGGPGVERDTGHLYSVSNQAIAMINRLVNLCKFHGVSTEKQIVFLCFTPSLCDGRIERTDFRLENWQQYVMYGLDYSFNNLDGETRNAKVFRAAVECLLMLTNNCDEIIESSARAVLSSNDELKVPHQMKITKKYEVLVSYTIPAHPEKSKLFTNVKDLRSGREYEYLVAEVDFPDDSRYLAGSISLEKETIKIRPNKSSWGDFFSNKNNVSEFSILIGDNSRRAKVVPVR